MDRYLKVFSRPQVIENSRQYSLLRTGILKKTVVGCPCPLACEQALLFGRAKRVSRERTSERRSLPVLLPRTSCEMVRLAQKVPVMEARFLLQNNNVRLDVYFDLRFPNVL